MSLKSFKKLAALLVVGLVLLAYSDSFNAEFHFDDITKISQNPAIRDISNIPYFFSNSGGHYQLGNYEFRPLKYATIALNYYLFGARPWSYHIFNLLLHFVNCWLVFICARIVFRAGGRDGDSAGRAAFATAAVFALHPLQTSTVMYMSNGRGVMLAGMFYLLAFISFVKFRQGGTGDRRAVYAWGLMSPAFFMLGLLCKEILVSLPVVMAMYDLLFTERKTSGLSGMRKAAVYYVPFAAVLALFILWKYTVHGYIAVRETPYSSYDYILSEARAFLIYIRLIFLPFNQNADYFLPVSNALGLKPVAGFGLIAALVVLLYRLRNRDAAATFFGAWFFIMLLPESSFVSFRDIAVEYRLYLPLAGFAGAGISLVMDSRPVRDYPAAAKRAFAVLLAIFCILSFTRNMKWRTETSFWSDVVAKSPFSPRAHANLGRAMLIDKRYPAAAAELSRSLELDPDYVQAGIVHFNLGMCYFETGIMGAAAVQFEDAINKGYDGPETYNKLGEADFKLGRYGEAAEAYRHALVPGENNPALEYNLATALMMDNKDEKATSLLEELLDSGFDNYDVRYDLALLYKRGGLRAKALENARLAASMAEDEQSRLNAETIIRELGRK